MGRTAARLLPALESVALPADSAATLPGDAHILAFVFAGLEQAFDRNLASTRPDTALLQLRLFARLQTRFHPQPLPTLARRFAAHADALVAAWRNRERREQIRTELHARAVAGQLEAMLALVDDTAGLGADARSAENAVRLLAEADAEMQAIDEGGMERAELARRLGQEAAVGLGLVALVGALGLAAFG